MINEREKVHFLATRTYQNVGIPSSEYSTSGVSKWVIPFNYGMPSEELFNMDELQKAAQKAIQGNNKKILQYGGAEGCLKLVDWLKNRFNEICDKENDDVLVTYGGSQALDLVARTLIDVGDEVWVEAPTYFGALFIFSTYGAKFKDFSVEEDGVNVNLIEAELERRACSGERMPKFIYTISNYQNPTGATLSIDKRKKLCELAVKYNLLIVEDDSYGHLSFDGISYSPIKYYGMDRTIYISTFSKLLAPGYRIGWIIADKYFIEEMRKMKPDGGTSGLIQEIVATLLEEIDYEEHIKLLQDSYRRKRDIMVNALKTYLPEDVKWNVPAGGFYIWISLPDKLDSNEIATKAMEKRVNFVPGRNFYIDEKGSNEMRLSYAYCQEDSIEIGVKKLSEVICEYLKVE